MNIPPLCRYPVERQGNEGFVRLFSGLRRSGDVGRRKQVPGRRIWITGCSEKGYLSVISTSAAFTVEALRVQLAHSGQGKYALLIPTTNRDLVLIPPQRSTIALNSLSKLTLTNSWKKRRTGPNPGVTSYTASSFTLAGSLAEDISLSSNQIGTPGGSNSTMIE